MAHDLPLPPRYRAALWKVKIRDRERVEPPHVTIMQKTRAWRLGLRTGGFLDAKPDPSEVPRDLVGHVLRNLPVLTAVWNEMYPENPV